MYPLAIRRGIVPGRVPPDNTLEQLSKLLGIQNQTFCCNCSSSIDAACKMSYHWPFLVNVSTRHSSRCDPFEPVLKPLWGHSMRSPGIRLDVSRDVLCGGEGIWPQSQSTSQPGGPTGDLTEKRSAVRVVTKNTRGQLRHRGPRETRFCHYRFGEE